jgi:hypothetical protein
LTSLRTSYNVDDPRSYKTICLKCNCVRIVLPIRSRVACRYCVFVCCMFRKELVRCPQAVFFVKSFLSLLYEFKSWFSVEVVSYDLPLRTRN